MFRIAEVTLANAVASGGTITVPYPSGTGLGSFAGFGHIMVATGLQGVFTQDAGGISVAFSTSITVTYNGSTPIPANSLVRFQFNIAGDDNLEIPDLSTVSPKVSFVHPIIIDLGVPAAIVTNGIAESQSDTGAHSLTLDGSLAEDGVVTLDVPRNVIVDSGGADTAVLTVIGTDEYGNDMRENITLAGTSAVAGKKAFKTITAINASATIANGAFVGTGDVLGLPVYVPSGAILEEYEDGAAASAGTFVAGVQTTATATTGDVRGTYDPNSAANGSKAFKLAVMLTDPTYKGVDQYDG